MSGTNLSNTTGEERSLAMICHLVSLLATTLLCNIFVPIVIMVISDSAFVKDQAREALNFQISVVFWALISVAVCFTVVGIVVGMAMLVVLGIAAFILPIVAAVKSGAGTAYRYPLTFRIVK